MVLIKDVEKVYLSNSENVHALQGVSAKISDGEFMAFAGPSGSGKTTLLNLVGCLDSLSKGSIFVDDEEISSLSSPQKSLIRQKKNRLYFSKLQSHSRSDRKGKRRTCARHSSYAY